MKYTSEIEIAKPIDQVIRLFDNPDNLPRWMDGLQSFEHISGTPGQPGAKSRLKFKMGNREMEMIETIKVRNLPDEFSGTYEAKGTLNLVKAKFVKLAESRTKYISEQEFQFKGVMKIMGFLMPGLFKKQTMKFLTSFKTFAENS
jgi:carbon monoxide dehydrogenase subunit G